MKLSEYIGIGLFIWNVVAIGIFCVTVAGLAFYHWDLSYFNPEYWDWKSIRLCYLILGIVTFLVGLEGFFK